MTTTEQNAYALLQQRWIRHQELRDEKASIATLAQSRKDLDDARLLVRITR